MEDLTSLNWSTRRGSVVCRRKTYSRRPNYLVARDRSRRNQRTESASENCSADCLRPRRRLDLRSTEPSCHHLIRRSRQQLDVRERRNRKTTITTTTIDWDNSTWCGLVPAHRKQNGVKSTCRYYDCDASLVSLFACTVYHQSNAPFITAIMHCQRSSHYSYFRKFVLDLNFCS